MTNGLTDDEVSSIVEFIDKVECHCGNPKEPNQLVCNICHMKGEAHDHSTL